MKFTVSGRIWIESDDGTLIGAGRIALLERIREYGSITEAARSMKMSYRQAWEQIESMNRQSEKPLVIKVSGGSGGGGSVLTNEGEQMIARYKRLMKHFDSFVSAESKAL